MKNKAMFDSNNVSPPSNEPANKGSKIESSSSRSTTRSSNSYNKKNETTMENAVETSAEAKSGGGEKAEPRDTTESSSRKKPPKSNSRKSPTPAQAPYQRDRKWKRIPVQHNNKNIGINDQSSSERPYKNQNSSRGSLRNSYNARQNSRMNQYSSRGPPQNSYNARQNSRMNQNSIRRPPRNFNTRQNFYFGDHRSTQNNCRSKQNNRFDESIDDTRYPPGAYIRQRQPYYKDRRRNKQNIRSDEPISHIKSSKGNSRRSSTSSYPISQRDKNKVRTRAPEQTSNKKTNGNPTDEEQINKPNEFVGVVLSESDGIVNFLAYAPKGRKFIRPLQIIRTEFPLSCYPGNWFRLIFDLGTDILKEILSELSEPLKPRKVVNCQKRMGTRIWGDTVNFFVNAMFKKCPPNKKNTAPANLFYYNSRLGILKLTRTELMEDLQECEFNEEKTDEENCIHDQLIEDSAVPGKLKLWCCLDEEQSNGRAIFRVTRIDARIWISNDTDSEKEEEDEALEPQDFDTLSTDMKKLVIKKANFSSDFCSWFTKLIDEYYNSKRLTSERRENIDSFVNYLQEISNKMSKKFDIRIFGSVNSGFGTDDCDLDLCLVPARDIGLTNEQEEFRNRKIWLNRLTKHFQEIGDFVVSPVLDARTPIMKFEHRKTGFHGDISMGNRLALHNTELLKLYTELDSRVAPLGFAIKGWAKLCGINDASAGNISSYAYIVMLIHFLQHTNPPVLPFLQEDITEEPVMVEKWKVSFTKDIQSLKAKLQKNPNTQSAAELFQEFLHYYAYEFKPATDVAQIRTSEQYDIKTRNIISTRLRLCVEDPFDLDHNLTSGVAIETLRYILKCFRCALKGMEKFDQEFFLDKRNESPKMDFMQFMRPFKPRRVVHISKKAPPNKSTQNEKSNNSEKNGEKSNNSEKNDDESITSEKSENPTTS